MHVSQGRTQDLRPEGAIVNKKKIIGFIPLFWRRLNKKSICQVWDPCQAQKDPFRPKGHSQDLKGTTQGWGPLWGSSHQAYGAF